MNRREAGKGGTLCHWHSWARLALFVAPTLHADRETSSRARPLESLMYQKQTKGSVFDGFILMAWDNEKQSCTRIMPTSFLTKVNKLRMSWGELWLFRGPLWVPDSILNPTGRSKSKKGFHWVRCWTSNQLVPMTLWAWYNWCNNRYHWCYKGINIDLELNWGENFFNLCPDNNFWWIDLFKWNDATWASDFHFFIIGWKFFFDFWN